MTKLILPRLIAKAHVSGYTNAHGTYVAPHEDKRQKHADALPSHQTSAPIADIPEKFRWVSEEQLQAASQIVDAVKSIPGKAVGIRVIPDEDEKAYTPGDSLEQSFKWKNGEITEKRIGGTSTAGIETKDIAGVLTALHNLGVLGKSGPNGYYVGTRVALVAGEKSKKGEDAGEKVITGARVLALWSKENDGLSKIKPAGVVTKSMPVLYRPS